MTEAKEKKLINESPQNFIRMASVNQNSKELLSAHSLLHQWAQEIRSSSPTMEIGENRWTLPWIAAAHEAVIRRLTQLKPKWQHNSPLNASAFSPHPIIIEYGAVDISGANGNVSVCMDQPVTIDHVIKTIQPDFTTKVMASLHPKNPGSMYHLALIPASQWRELGENKKEAAVTAFRSVMGPAINDPGYEKDIIKASFEIKIAAREAETRLEAEAVAIEIASRVISGDMKEPDFTQISASRMYIEEMMKVGMEMLTKLLEPIENHALLIKGEKQLKAALNKVKAKGRPTKAEAKDIARTAAFIIAKKLKAK